MGLTKTDIYSERQNQLAQLAKALGHPARLAIIEHLLKINSCVCGELVTEIGLAQATISQHLKELKQAGLIQGTISGTSVCYCLDAENWSGFISAFDQLFQKIKMQNPNCC